MKIFGNGKLFTAFSTNEDQESLTNAINEKGESITFTMPLNDNSRENVRVFAKELLKIADNPEAKTIGMGLIK